MAIHLLCVPWCSGHWTQVAKLRYRRNDDSKKLTDAYASGWTSLINPTRPYSATM